ncbi:hypothetical protein [Nocardia anaemiae]|uniref:hypothetical protein n=1 Tax=Nocardia anaemiae TaxID=263910 RepID=UPI0012F4B15E|nr:hypothetical protein [Nocardia anaemiae]
MPVSSGPEFVVALGIPAWAERVLARACWVPEVVVVAGRSEFPGAEWWVLVLSGPEFVVVLRIPA